MTLEPNRYWVVIDTRGVILTTPRDTREQAEDEYASRKGWVFPVLRRDTGVRCVEVEIREALP